MIRSLLALILLVVACTHIPAVTPMDTGDKRVIHSRCRSIFPSGRWQLVHTIDAHLGGGHRATFTGVVVLSAKVRSIHCVLMTLEGMVLFEAVAGDGITVKRAIGPFENPDFADGLIQDLRLLFFEPKATSEPVAAIFPEGARGCRYHTDDDRIVDVFNTDDNIWHIRQYDPERMVVACGVDGRGVAKKLTLASKARHGYKLDMTLVEAILLP